MSIRCLIEGNSVGSTCRITGTSKGAVLALSRCVPHLTCKRIQRDEIWQFVGMKAKTAQRREQTGFGVGDVWTWVAVVDADTKLVSSWLIGDPDAGSTLRAGLRIACSLLPMATRPGAPDTARGTSHGSQNHVAERED